MKTLVRILLAPIVWLFQACSPLGKPVDLDKSDNFYFNKSKTDIIYSSMGNWFELGKAPLNADVESFVVLNKHIGKDKNSAYYREHAITDPNLDLESFRASQEDWMWHIGMDKNRVYSLSHDVVDGEWKLITKIIEGADPNTFRQYESNWSKDGSKHFYNHKALAVDYDSFEIVNKFFAKDKDSVYVYFYPGRFKSIEAESATLQVIDDYYIRDTDNIFFFQDYLRREETNILTA
ncbi:MAG: DKNYY domain-containing protein [Bacteroidota bacterium]